MLVRFQFWPTDTQPTPPEQRQTIAINPTTVGSVKDANPSFCEMTLRNGDTFMVAGSFDEVLNRLEPSKVEAA